MAVGFETGKEALALNPKPAFCITSAADSVPLPQSEPRAMREHLVVSSIRSRDVGCAEWPRIRRFEHFLYLLDFVNNTFNVHTSQSSSTKCECVKRKRDWSFLSDSCIASPCASARNEHALLLPTGTEYHVEHERNTPTTPRRRLVGSLGAKRGPSSGRARRGRGLMRKMKETSRTLKATMMKRVAEATRCRCAVCVSGEG